MNAEHWAALGSRRGVGESLASWLRAGPLGTQVCDAPGGSELVGGQLYCPACRVDEAGRRRWYTREGWPVDGVVCTTHALPLLRCDGPPARLRSRRWSPVLRDEFHALGAWTQQGNVGVVGRAIVRAICARSDPRAAYSQAWAEAQWHLWAIEWPVPAAPRLPRRGRLTPVYQCDRLALMAIAHRVHVALAAGRDTGWPTLPIRARVLRWLEGRVGQVHPSWHARIARCFCDGAKPRPRS
jgi:hypothetical protein